MNKIFVFYSYLSVSLCVVCSCNESNAHNYNSGIGYAATLDLASRGCKVIVACRSNSEKVKNDITKATHNPNVTVKFLDLASLQSVREFCKEIHQEEEKIDILINNAGIAGAIDHTDDGLNPVMQTNAFAPFLLTHLLVDLLKNSDDARIVFNSSAYAFLNNLTLNNLNNTMKKNFSLWKFLEIYGNSKLVMAIVSQEFADRLQRFNIKSNAVHPGAVQTDLHLDLKKIKSASNWWYVKLHLAAYHFLFRTPDEGAQRIIELAVADECKSVTGKFWWGPDWYPNPTRLRDKEFCGQIWQEIETLVKLSDNERAC